MAEQATKMPPEFHVIRVRAVLPGRNKTGYYGLAPHLCRTIKDGEEFECYEKDFSDAHREVWFPCQRCVMCKAGKPDDCKSKNKLRPGWMEKIDEALPRPPLSPLPEPTYVRPAGELNVDSPTVSDDVPQEPSTAHVPQEAEPPPEGGKEKPKSKSPVRRRNNLPAGPGARPAGADPSPARVARR